MRRIATLKPAHWLGLAVVLVVVAGGLATLWRAPSSANARLAEALEVCVVAPPLPFDPASGLALHAPRPVPADARCPVCGMFPARSLPWAAQLIFANGDTHFFDSPLSLLIYLQDVGRYTPGRQASEIAVSFVTDTHGGAWIDLTQAVFVGGSNALGPMRAGNFAAFSSPEQAQQFVRQRGGELLTAVQIGPERLQALNGARLHAHE